MRKELAWLRRGPPARTSKPKFRIQAANELIANEPPPRDSLVLQRFATTRLGKDVFDLHRVAAGGRRPRMILDQLDWSIGPGARIGLVGVNGTGKTSVLRLLAGEWQPDRGHHQARQDPADRLSQPGAGRDDGGRPGRSMPSRIAAASAELAGGREISADTLLQDFGFTGDKLIARIADLSGGERRRLQFLRILLDEPNVLLLDEPTNDLDIDTLTVIEDYLDDWPGTLIVVTHDRYFLERVTDVTYALTGGGRCDQLPGGIEQYLADRAAAEPTPAGRSRSARNRRRHGSGVQARRWPVSKANWPSSTNGSPSMHESMAEAAADHVRAGELNAELERPAGAQGTTRRGVACGRRRVADCLRCVGALLAAAVGSVVALLAATGRAAICSGWLGRTRRHRTGRLGRLRQQCVGVADHAVRRAGPARVVRRDVSGAAPGDSGARRAATAVGAPHRRVPDDHRAVLRDLSGVEDVRRGLARHSRSPRWITGVGDAMTARWRPASPASSIRTRCPSARPPG